MNTTWLHLLVEGELVCLGLCGIGPDTEHGRLAHQGLAGHELADAAEAVRDRAGWTHGPDAGGCMPASLEGHLHSG